MFEKPPGQFRGDISTELSDVILAETFGKDEKVFLTIENETCKAWQLEQAFLHFVQNSSVYAF